MGNKGLQPQTVCYIYFSKDTGKVCDSCKTYNYMGFYEQDVFKFICATEAASQG